MNHKVKIQNQMIFFALFYLAFYAITFYLLNQTLLSHSSWVIAGMQILLVIFSLSYWPIIFLGSVAGAWTLWTILSIFLLAIAFPFELTFLYWNIPLHVIMIMALTTLKKYEISMNLQQKMKIQMISEDSNELEASLKHKQKLTGSFDDLIKRYALLNNILNTLNSSLDEEEVIQLILQKTQIIVSKGRDFLFYINTRTDPEIKLRGSSSTAREIKEFSDTNEDIFGEWVYKHKLPLLVTDINKDFRFQSEQVPKQNEFQSIMMAPLIHNDQCLGLIRIHSPLTNVFILDDLRLMSILANITTKAIINARLYEQTHELAIKDSLTGLYVRKYFSERFEEEIKRSMLANTPFSLALLDIDHFKKYNDTYGHIAGDKVLGFLAKILADQLSQDCIVARLGGEEFAVLMPNHTQEQAYQRIDALREHIFQQVFELRQVKTHISVSGGIATFPDQALTQTGLIDISDKGLYKAKDEGRNKICCF